MTVTQQKIESAWNCKTILQQIAHWLMKISMFLVIPIFSMYCNKKEGNIIVEKKTFWFRGCGKLCNLPLIKLKARDRLLFTEHKALFNINLKDGLCMINLETKIAHRVPKKSFYSQKGVFQQFKIILSSVYPAYNVNVPGNTI